MENNEMVHFNKMAEEKGYAWWGSKTHSGRVRKKVRAQMARKYLGDFRDKIILEIGCASGDYTKVLVEEFVNNKIIATDISSGQIDLARKNVIKNNVQFKVDNSENMQIENESIDYIIANSILHHVNIEKCLKECFRVLKKGGKIFITEPNMFNPQVFIEKTIPFIKKAAGHSPDESAFYRWQIKEDFKRQGFKNIKVMNFDFLHPIIPKFFTSFFNCLSRLLEKIPLIKEISGSLIIIAQK